MKYLLSVAAIEGTDLSSASAGIPQNAVDWVVDLSFNGSATDTFTEISRALYGTQKQFAIVLDGQVISAPTMNGLITNGQAQISGDFTQTEAQSLATSLKFGALPISFDDQSTQVETIGPSLAGNQLSAGLMAGALGLALVMIYCLLLLPRARPRRRRVAVRRGGRDVRPGAAAQRERRLHAVAARHRGPDRGGRHHRRLVHRVLRADP